MPRGSFKYEDASTGGLQFQEGNVLIQYSRAVVFQYPPNRETKKQSDAFPALLWRGVRCDRDWNETGEEVEIPIRMGELEQVRPGKVQPRDFDNLAVMPEDLGSAVGTEGNCFHVESGAKFPKGWGILDESMR